MKKINLISKLVAVLSWMICMNASLANQLSTIVAIESGKIKGTLKNDVLFFGGIPYATPPEGDLRWRAPVAPEPWADIKDTSQFGKVCVQPKLNKKIALYVQNQSEDCLTLNIWVPKSVSENATAVLPVMVWLHGGAFKVGAGSIPVYNGEQFAKSGVVLITLNYRLGDLGFFGHPSITHEKNRAAASGNFGLLDQIAALQWIQKNITAFGGDKNNITIFGESAGAVSVNYLMTLEETKGLFHRAISQSGGGLQVPTDRQKSKRRKPSEIERTEDVAKAWGVKGRNDIAKKLRALSIETLLNSGQKLNLGGGPYVDKVLIKQSVAESFSKGVQHDVPYLAGANSYEGSLMEIIMKDRDPELIFWTVDGDRRKARQLYINDSVPAKEAAFEFFGDSIFSAGARYLADKMSSKVSPAWLYHFDYVAKHQRDKTPGASHGGEILYVFDTFEQLLPVNKAAIVDEDRKMSEKLHAYWVNFAKFGDPNGETLTAWPTFTSEDKNTLIFSPTKTYVNKHFKNEKLEFAIEHATQNNPNID